MFSQNFTMFSEAVVKIFNQTFSIANLYFYVHLLHIIPVPKIPALSIILKRNLFVQKGILLSAQSSDVLLQKLKLLYKYL